MLAMPPLVSVPSGSYLSGVNEVGKLFSNGTVHGKN